MLGLGGIGFSGCFLDGLGWESRNDILSLIRMSLRIVLGTGLGGRLSRTGASALWIVVAPHGQ